MEISTVYSVHFKDIISPSSPPLSSPPPLPSEQRYSANLVLGLGIVHIVLGFLCILFALLAIFTGEEEANQFAAGAWTGPIFVACGLLGILAHTRWYVKWQIWLFLLASVVSTAAAVTCIFLTASGIHLTKAQVWQNLQMQVNTPYITNVNPHEAKKSFVVTSNLIVTAILELLWSLVSSYVALQGSKAKEYNFASSGTSKTDPKALEHQSEV